MSAMKAFFMVQVLPLSYRLLAEGIVNRRANNIGLIIPVDLGVRLARTAFAVLTNEW
jgi:hypothetical protein